MSRLAQSKPTPAPRKEARIGGLGDTQDEICPVCKSSRYLNASLRFLVNPECYHKMCESCVDRIFSHGPAQCPISGCPRTLRKHRFREQTFEDIKVEREVDIRRRIAAVFNRREDDFEDLRAYNDYLNEVEDITFNLVNGIDVEETEKRFEAYKKANADDIAENTELAKKENLSYSSLQKQEREQARLRREAARREEEEDRREAEENRRDVLARLASGQDADAIAKHGQQVQLKRRMDRQEQAERQQRLKNASAASNGAAPLIKGLKRRKDAGPEAPIDPFGGLSFEGRKHFNLLDDYVWQGIRETKGAVKSTAGGYDVRDFTNRALTEAFGGLGIFLADDVHEGEKAGQDALSAGTARAEFGAADVKMLDAA
ncbi:hypothetical protein MBLNU230_g2910t1 [Neophaeotheca triangularis]